MLGKERGNKNLYLKGAFQGESVILSFGIGWSLFRVTWERS